MSLPRDIVTISDKSHNTISTVTVTLESGMGKTITKSNKSQNMIVSKSDKLTSHYTPMSKGLHVLFARREFG